MLIQDHANRCVGSDTRILNKRGCDIAVFSFEGGHQEAPDAHTTDALRWILREEGEQPLTSVDHDARIRFDFSHLFRLHPDNHARHHLPTL